MSAKLIDEIIAAATDSRSPIGDLLRKCQILGHKLGVQELASWASFELNGYPDANVPNYRRISGQAYGNFHDGYGRQMRHAPIPAGVLPQEFKVWCRKANLRMPIAGIEDLVQGEEKGSLSIPWPHELTLKYGSKVFEHCQCTEAYLSIPRGSIIGLLDSVRNRVLSFVLEIQGQNPELHESMEEECRGEGNREEMRQAFITTVYGSVGNISVNSKNLSQVNIENVSPGDFDSVRKTLIQLGFQKDEIEELENAIENDGKNSTGSQEIGPETSAWFTKILTRARQGASKIPEQVASGIVLEILLKFLGLS